MGLCASSGDLITLHCFKIILALAHSNDSGSVLKGSSFAQMERQLLSVDPQKRSGVASWFSFATTTAPGTTRLPSQPKFPLFDNLLP